MQSNALKFTEFGSVTIKAMIELQEEVQYLKISVKDTGIGISEAN